MNSCNTRWAMFHAIIVLALFAVYCTQNNNPPPPSGEFFTETVGGVSFKMVKVEAGSFRMGCTSELGSECWDDGERPDHQVTLTRDYYIGEFEVTQGLWSAVMGSSI